MAIFRWVTAVVDDTPKLQIDIRITNANVGKP